MENPEPYNLALRNGLAVLGENRLPQEQKVINAIIHEPFAKLRFEQAKLKIHLGAISDAFEILIEGVANLNSDWRSVYRSFYLLASIDTRNSSNWLERGIRCNPEYPLMSIRHKTFYLSTYS